MSELKTLRDIDPEACCHGIRADDLKREAIKWIKACDHPVDFTRNDRCGSNSKEYCCCCQRFKRFFNITEEDLKEAKNKK